MTEPRRKRRYRGRRERQREREMMRTKRREEGKHEIYTNIYEFPCSKSCRSNKIQKHMLTGEYREGHFGSMGATEAAEWEREVMSQ